MQGCRQEVSDERGCRDHLIEVVQQEQQMLLLQGCAQPSLNPFPLKCSNGCCVSLTSARRTMNTAVQPADWMQHPALQAAATAFMRSMEAIERFAVHHTCAIQAADCKAVL